MCLGLRLISDHWEHWDQSLENEDPSNIFNKIGACTNLEGRCVQWVFYSMGRGWKGEC